MDQVRSYLFVPAEGVGQIVCNHLIETGEMSRVFREESLEPLLEAGGRGVGMETDSPEAGFLRDRLPELLGNPEDFVLCEGPSGESVG